ncbi:MAG: hypothetical protein DRN15_00465 [Thermoprotei archaeon]|nr:MAG: hypothetical protein DRN15_00465 [Thermoprotei archaeon]RLF25664.1 MAG: hypothetical protein DRM97_01045 [Thermoprotei archaeon]
MKALFKRAAMGGTFHLIHKGHEELFKEAFYLADLVVVGLSSDDLVRKLGKRHPVASFKDRLRVVGEFLVKKGWLRRCLLFKLDDRYGPTINDPEIDLIVVSEETLDVAFMINYMRKKKGYPPLSIAVIKTVLADDGKPISTTRIIAGEIDKEGRLLKIA